MSNRMTRRQALAAGGTCAAAQAGSGTGEHRRRRQVHARGGIDIRRHPPGTVYLAVKTSPGTGDISRFSAQ